MSDAAVDEVEAVIQGWADAYRRRDIDALMRTAIGEASQLVGTGADEVRFGLAAYREQVERDYAQSDAVEFSLTNMRTTTIDNAAFVYADVSVAGSVGGESFSMSGLRMTAGMVRTDDGWKIVQSHLSAPDGAQDAGSSFEG